MMRLRVQVVRGAGHALLSEPGLSLLELMQAEGFLTTRRTFTSRCALLNRLRLPLAIHMGHAADGRAICLSPTLIILSAAKGTSQQTAPVCLPCPTPQGKARQPACPRRGWACGDPLARGAPGLHVLSCGPPHTTYHCMSCSPTPHAACLHAARPLHPPSITTYPI